MMIDAFGYQEPGKRNRWIKVSELSRLVGEFDSTAADYFKTELPLTKWFFREGIKKAVSEQGLKRKDVAKLLDAETEAISGKNPGNGKKFGKAIKSLFSALSTDGKFVSIGDF